jgi:hypothetical protein
MRTSDQYTPGMLRRKPMAWWMLPWGLLAGLLLTLAFLGQMNFKALSGCGQATSAPYRTYSLPGGCSTIEEGYPVRFLSSSPVLEQNPGAAWRTANVGSAPVMDVGGLAEDWLVWSLVSSAALYVLWPARRTDGRKHTVPGAPAALRPGHGQN